MAPVARYLSAACLAGALSLASLPSRAGHDYEEPVAFTPADQVKQLLDIGEQVTFVDIREAADYGKGHLPKAISIPVSEFGHRWSEIPKTGRVILYCTCPPGQRDETYAFLLLRQQRYLNITFIDGGYAGWVKRGYPVAAP